MFISRVPQIVGFSQAIHDFSWLNTTGIGVQYEYHIIVVYKVKPKGF